MIMTENGDPYENAIAERVNGILKADFRLSRIFKSQAEAMIAIEAAAHNYNTLRSHMSGPPQRLRLAYTTRRPYI